MFQKSPAPLDFSSQAGQNASLQAVDALAKKFASDLLVPLYQGGSMSSSADVASQGNCVAVDLSTNTWQGEVTTFVSSYDAAGYGGYGGIEPTPEPTPITRHFNQGIGNGMEGGDPGKSAPHGGSNDETGRTPGQRWIPKLF